MLLYKILAILSRKKSICSFFYASEQPTFCEAKLSMRAAFVAADWAMVNGNGCFFCRYRIDPSVKTK